MTFNVFNYRPVGNEQLFGRRWFQIRFRILYTSSSARCLCEHKMYFFSLTKRFMLECVYRNVSEYKNDVQKAIAQSFMLLAAKRGTKLIEVKDLGKVIRHLGMRVHSLSDSIIHTVHCSSKQSYGFIVCSRVTLSFKTKKKIWIP